MPTSDLPAFVRDTLKTIASMSAEQFTALQTSLEKSHASTDTAALLADVKRSIGIDISDLEGVIDGLIGMAFQLESQSAEAYANDVAAIISKSQKGFDQSNLEKRLSALLSASVLQTSAKAIRLQREYENVFASGRILSDIRPVFSSTGTDALGAITVHNLKISYYGSTGESREMFFALDNSDLAALKTAIERAEKKAVTLERLIAKSGMEALTSRKE